MQNRIKQLRKSLGLTQQEFAERLGSVQNTITGYETGRRVPSNPAISNMVREFNVNETWLRTGEGEMFAPVNRENEIARFMGSILGEDNSFRRRFIAALSRLDADEWALIEKMACDIVGEDNAKKE